MIGLSTTIPTGLPELFRAAIADALQEAVQMWHWAFLPLHFEVQASDQYAYKPRTAQYQRYKGKRFGHQRPLELTGDSKRMLTSTIRITAGPSSAKGVMKAPKYFYMYNKNNGRQFVDKADEATRTTASEVQSLALTFQDKASRRMNAPAKTVTIK